MPIGGFLHFSPAGVNENPARVMSASDEASAVGDGMNLLILRNVSTVNVLVGGSGLTQANGALLILPGQVLTVEMSAGIPHACRESGSGSIAGALRVQVGRK